MRPRTFILLILVLLAVAAVVVLVILNNAGSGPLANLLPGGDDNGTAATTEDGEDAADGIAAQPVATPEPVLQPVVVAKARLPVGEQLTSELLEVEMRPSTNVAIQGGYTFSDTNQLVNQLTKVDIPRGQEILAPMLAVNVTDIASLGSDLSLYVDQGKVAVAVPMNRFTGAGFSMRPGDLVDVMMTLRIIEIDPTFGTSLPNNVERVIQSALLDGREFLFPPISDGRLEFIPEINQVAAIIPSTIFVEGQDFEAGSPIPKRVTQLTVQQAEVLWVGTWFDHQEADLILDEAVFAAEEEAAQQAEQAENGEASTIERIDEIPQRIDARPDVVILSMSTQDALALKWALEHGVEIDLSLRSPGDNTTFVTTSVSLPQIFAQGGLAIPEQADFDLHPRADEVVTPFLPPELIIITVEEFEINEDPELEEPGTP